MVETVVEQIHERLSILKEECGDFRIARHHPDDSTQLDPYLYEDGDRVAISAPWIYSDTSIADKDIEYNHRAVLPCEVVWEKDTPNIMENIVRGLRVYEKLLRDNIKASAWFTAGKSLHVHAFFKKDKRIHNERFFKQYLWNKYKEGEGWDKGLVSGKHLVRMEQGLHEMSGGRKFLLIGEPLPYFNTLNDETIKEMELAQLKYEMSMARQDYKERINQGTIPGCINAFYSPAFKDKKDGRKRGLFILAATLVQSTSYDETFKKLKEWNDLVGAGYNDAKIRGMISHVSSSRRFMHCLYRHEFFQELGIPISCNNEYISPDRRKEKDGENPCAIEETMRI